MNSTWHVNLYVRIKTNIYGRKYRRKSLLLWFGGVLKNNITFIKIKKILCFKDTIKKRKYMPYTKIEM